MMWSINKEKTDITELEDCKTRSYNTYVMMV
jgi:hypothetical protein